MLLQTTDRDNMAQDVQINLSRLDSFVIFFLNLSASSSDSGGREMLTDSVIQNLLGKSF